MHALSSRPAAAAVPVNRAANVTTRAAAAPQPRNEVPGAPAPLNRRALIGTIHSAALLVGFGGIVGGAAPAAALEGPFSVDDFYDEGYIETNTGLLYKVLQEGTGKPAYTFVPNPFVKVEFEGFTMNGKKFTSTFDDRRQFGFQVGLVQRVTPGFDEAVYGMKLGEVRRVYVPPELGFGRRGMPAGVGPNAELVYEIELKSIIPY